MKSIDKLQKEELERMKKQLSLIGSKEGNFISVEILFYEAITFSRTLGEAEDNQLLTALKQIQATEYRAAKEHYSKSTMREKAIRRFISRFKIALAETINLHKKQGKLEAQ